MKRLVAILLCALARPLLAATFTVTNTNDAGAGSLRQAIEDANGAAGADTITFNIPGAGVHTITPVTLLPIIGTPMTIDGYTQPGSTANTNATGALNTVLQIEIDGTSAPNRCITIGSNDVVVRGLVVNRCSESFELFNPFGANVTGIVIAGNFIGTDAAGLATSGNQVGVAVGFTQGGTVGATIGGPNPADRNLISGNANTGIFTTSNFNGGSSTVIQGNIIGLDKNAALPVPNFNFGIYIAGQGPTTSTIGGPATGEGNIIAGNSNVGVGVETSPETATIRGNAIFDNGALGIRLGSQNDLTLPLPNDADDSDAGANGRQNYPIVSSVAAQLSQGSSTRIQGVLHSKASTTYDLDFYENPACSNTPREFLEGKTYLGTGPVTTDASGTGVFDVTLNVTVEAGARITATATDPTGATSEFSQRIPYATNIHSGPPEGGTSLSLSGSDFLDGLSATVGGIPATNVSAGSFTTGFLTTPALPAGSVNDIVVTNLDGSSGTIAKAFVSDFLDVTGGQFYSFVTTLVSNAITAGVGGGLYGVDQGTKRQQMAVFLLKAEHGLCYTPPPCAGTFPDVPCTNNFAPWIEALAAEGITTGCGGGNFCPNNFVTRRQMAVFLLKTKYGSSYVPPDCTGVFDDVACPGAPAVNFIEELAAEQITGGCQVSPPLYCPDNSSTRGQMAVFITKTFSLQ